MKKVDGAAYYQLKVSCSVPPNTILHIRPGYVQRGPYFIAQETIYFPALDLDFSSASQFYESYTGVFITANAYLPILVSYRSEYFIALRDDDDTVLPVMTFGDTEYATATDAEQAIAGWMDGTNVLYWGDLPMFAIILKNNGTTGVEGQVQPIDPINRGRSYFWRDLRPVHNTLYYDGYY